MVKFDWNTLRPGERVVVHDPGSHHLALTPGVVVMVDTHRGINGVGIRLETPDGLAPVRWPSHVAVHRQPHVPGEGEPCWRCDAVPE